MYVLVSDIKVKREAGPIKRGLENGTHHQAGELYKAP